MKKKNKTAANQRAPRASQAVPDKLPFMEHVRELRRRLVYIGIAVGVGSAAAYGFEHQIIDILLKPSGEQHFIYTSPLGGMNFLFTVCLDIGLILATPVIIYQSLAFLQPLMKETTRRFLRWMSAISGVVALSGVAFGYFIGLPSALHFLLHQFKTIQVQPLITIQSYMQFVALYLLGCALMFQLPLIVLLINRIKPIGPRSLLKYERHMIAGAVIVAFIMNPSPNIIDQLFVVVPITLSYQVSILLLWYIKRRNRPVQALQQLREQDGQRLSERTHRDLNPVGAFEYAANSAFVPLEADEVFVNVRVIKTKREPAAPEPIAVPISEAESIPVRVATIRPAKRSAISVATTIEVAHRSAKTAPAAQAVHEPEPAPITYTPEPEVEHIDVRVIRPRPIDLARRSFIPSLRSQLIQ